MQPLVRSPQAVSIGRACAEAIFVDWCRNLIRLQPA
jgi:hypothetical protein